MFLGYKYIFIVGLKCKMLEPTSTLNRTSLSSQRKAYVDTPWIKWAKRPWILALGFGLAHVFLAKFFLVFVPFPYYNNLFLFDGLNWIVSSLLCYLLLRLGLSLFWNHLGGVTEKLNEDNRNLESLHRATAFGLASLTVTRDQSTEVQFTRIGRFAVILAKELRSSPRLGSYLSDQYIDDLEVAAPLHDIGRIGLSDQILHKGSGLTMSEYESMRMHVIVGGDLIAELQRHLPTSMNPRKSVYSLAREIAYHHHQQWDGTGYPFVLRERGRESYFIQEGIGRPLKGDEIPLSARIVAVADVYNALISPKKWRPAYTHEEAIAEIQKGRGTKFDPEVADALQRCQLELKFVVESERLENF